MKAPRNSPARFSCPADQVQRERAAFPSFGWPTRATDGAFSQRLIHRTPPEWFPRPLRPLLRVAGFGADPAATEDAWRRIEAFFDEHLG